MTDTAPPEYSNLPASAVLLVVLLIVSIAMTFVVGLFLTPICIVVAILWAMKFLYDFVRWLRTDKTTRPKMRFPKKSALALFVVVLCVGYFGYLLGTEEPW